MRVQTQRARSRGVSRKLLVPLVVLCCLPLCQCYVWRTHKSLSAAQQTALEVREEDMQGTALYHLTTGKELLEAAEKQYEDADFKAARRFADEARKQILRAKKIDQLNRQATSSTDGGPP